MFINYYLLTYLNLDIYNGIQVWQGYGSSYYRISRHYLKRATLTRTSLF